MSILDTIEINNHLELKRVIMKLNYKREEQEEEIKYKIKELYYSFHPLTIIKSGLDSILHTPEINEDIKTIGVNVGIDYIVGRLFKRSSSIKGFLASIVVEKLAEKLFSKNPDFLKNSLNKIVDLVGRFKQHKN
ncbi:MAG: hypothetical protein ABI315_03565 [Bacteroidia bacterium]